MPKFGDLEAAIMDQMWRSDRPMLVREVVDGIRADRPIAVTTVQTVMEILFRKGWLTRMKDGRAFRYSAASPREEYTAQLLSEALETTPNRGAALSRLMERMRPDEIAELRDALSQAEPANRAKPARPAKPGRRRRTR